MISLKAKIRNKFGKQTKSLRKKDIIPAVLYGPTLPKNFFLEVDRKEFENIYRQAGESSLISLEVLDKKFLVLIHQIARDPINGEFLHIDFYHPSSKKKVEAEIALVFEGEAPAVKELGGTLVKELQTVGVKGLAEDLPREIKINVENLKTFEDRILIQDLEIPKGVEILENPEEIVVHIAPPERVKEELAAEEPVSVKATAGKEKIEGEKIKEEKKVEEEKSKKREKKK
jgi:large subunit ribosomal protein L25